MILITGSTIPLARALIAHLPATQVRLYTNDPRADPGTTSGEYTGDLCDRTFVDRLVAGVTTIIHLDPIDETLDPDVAVAHASCGTYQLVDAAANAGVRKVVLASTLALFNRLPASWQVTEEWRPRPTAASAELCAWLAECSARALTRDTGLAVVCLRFGQITARDDAGLLADARQVHIADALHAVECALAYPQLGWSIFHIAAAGEYAKLRVRAAGEAAFGYQPRYAVARAALPGASAESWRNALAPSAPVASRPIRRVVMLGAGGPVGVAAAALLGQEYTLHLTDIQLLAEIAARNEPQSPGAPVPVPTLPPHTEAIVDIGNYAQVYAACAGADAIINCSVMRRDPVAAFRVNTLGAYHVMRAAVAHGIRRVVHTGPYQIAPSGITSYGWDHEIHADAPPRPGRAHGWQIYFHSKYLGQEICRVYAEHYGLEVPVLLFADFVDAALPPYREVHSLAVSFQDAARAIRCALMVPTLPNPYEPLHIGADLPHGVFPNEKARRVLEWQPLDDLQGWWDRS